MFRGVGDGICYVTQRAVWQAFQYFSRPCHVSPGAKVHYDYPLIETLQQPGATIVGTGITPESVSNYVFVSKILVSTEAK